MKMAATAASATVLPAQKASGRAQGAQAARPR